jgi:hypothetical protein
VINEMKTINETKEALGYPVGQCRTVPSGRTTAARARCPRNHWCGVDNHDDGFAACLAREITARTQLPVRWQAVGQFGLSAIVDDLTERADQVIIAGMPPFELLPSVPAILGHYLSERATALDEVTQQICAGHSFTTWVTMTGVPPADFFSSDRFHPSAAGYRLWAQAVADRLVPRPKG